MEDKLTKDIRQKMKQVARDTAKYSGNVGKSMLHSAKFIGRINMPNLTNFVDVNKDLVTDVLNTLKNPKSLSSRLDTISNSAEMKEMKELMHNALDDLKTGKFYDETRDRSEFGKTTQELLNSFGGVDLSFTDDGDYVEPSDDASMDMDLKIAKVQEENADDRTKLTISSIGASSDAIVQSQQAIHNDDIKVRLKQHSQTMTGFANLITVNSAMFEANNSMMIALTETVRESNNAIMGSLSEMTGLLKEIRDNTKSSSMFEIPYEEQNLPLKNGVLDMKKYIKHVLGNVDNKYQISSNLSMAMMGMSTKEFIALYKNNPLQFVTDRLVLAMVPDVSKSVAASFDKSIGGFFSSLLLKINSRLQDDPNDLIGSIFGLKINSRKTIDTSKYNTGAIKFNGKVEKAITEVIPTYLAEIAEAVTGRAKKVYNYDRGEFVDPFKSMEEYQKRINDFTNQMTRTMSLIDQKLKNVNFANDDQEAMFRRDLNRYFQTMASRQSYINPYVKSGDMGVTFESRNSEALIKGLFKSFNRGDLMNANKELLYGLVDKDAANAGLTKELQKNGLISIFNKFDDRYDKIADETKYGKNYDKTMLDKINSEIGGAGVPKLLTDIRDILARGIITYSHKADGKSVKIPKAIIDDANKYFTNKDKLDAKTSDEKTRRVKEYSDSDREARGADLRKKLYFGPGADISSEYASSLFKDIEDEMISTNMEKEEKLRQNRFLYKVLKEKKLSRRILMVGEQFKKALDAPFVPITKAMAHLDKKMYQIIYGTDTDGSDPNKGMIDKFTKMVQFNLETFRNWLDDRILKPLDDRLFGEKGIITKMQGRLNPYTNKAKRYIRDKYNQAKKYLLGDEMQTPDMEAEMIVGPDGTLIPQMRKSYTGGALSRYANYFNEQKSKIFNQVSTYGKNIFTAIRQGIFGADDEYIFDEKTGETKVVEHAGLMGNLKGLFNSVKSSLSDFLFGKDKYVDGKFVETESKKLFKEVAGEFKGFAPKAAAGALTGIVGSGAFGLLTSLFLPGGPLVAGLLGTFGAFVSHSDKFRKYLFGNEEEDGVIDREIVDGFKKFAPKVGMGFGLGALITNFGLLGASILPGGPIMGGFIGSIVGMTAASDQMKELLFGDSVDPKSGLISKEFRDKVKESLPMGLTGGVGGFALGAMLSKFGILGFQFLPGGPILGALAGIGAALNADKIKEFFFGKKDKEGNWEKDGVFRSMFNFGKEKLFDPFIKGINNAGKGIGKWFQESIVSQFSEALNPLKEEFRRSKKHVADAFKNFGTHIKDSISSVFEKHFGAPLGELVEKHITGPIKNVMGKIVGFIGSVIGGILSLPFRALNRYAQGLDAKHKREDKKEAMGNFFKGLFRGNSDKDKESSGDGFLSWVVKMRTQSNSILEGMSSSVNSFLTNMGLGFLITKDNAINKAKDIKDSMKATANDIGIGINMTKDALADRIRNIKDRISRGEQVSEEEIKEVEAAEAQVSPGKKSIRQMISDWWANAKKKPDATATVSAGAGPKDKKTGESSIYDNVDERKDAKVKGTTPYKLLKSISESNKTIKNEVKGQLDGVGYNLEYIRNIMVDQFGPPDVMPGVMKGLRGNRRRRGIIGKIYDVVSYPFKMIGEKISEGLGIVADKGKSVLSFIFSPFKLIGSAVSATLSGIQTLGNMVTSLLPIVGDLVSIFGTFLKEGLKLGVEVIGTTISTAVKGIGSAVEALGGFVKGFTETLGSTLGNILNGLSSAGASAITAIGKMTETLFDITRVVLPEMLKAMFGVGKLVLGGIGKGALGIAKFVFGSLIPESVKRKITGKSHFIEGGTLDVVKRVDDVRFKDGNGITSSSLNLVNIIAGKPMNLPTKALPVYVLGGKLTTTRDYSKHRPDKDKDIAQELAEELGAPVGTGTSSTANSNQVKGFKRKFIELYQKLRTDSSDKIRILNTNLSNLGADSDKSAIEQSTLLQIADSGIKTKGLLSRLIDGDKKKDNGLLSMLSKMFPYLGALLSGIVPFLGTAYSALTGNWERVAINLAKKIPFVKDAANAGLKKLGKNAGEFFTTKVKPFISNTIDSVKGRFADPMADVAVKGTAVEIGQEVAEKSSAGLIQRILSAIRKAVFSDKILQKIGGRATLKNIGPFFTMLSKKMSGTAIGKMGAKILAKCSPINIAFMVYDLTTGMAEAGNIFRIHGGTITWKMRVTAGLSKMISGLLFGIITDRFIASMLYRFIADEDEQDRLYSEQEQLQKEVAQYNKEHGTDFSVDQYNSKYGSQRTLTRVTGAIKTGVTKVSGFMNALSNPFSGFSTFRNTDTVAKMLGIDPKQVGLSERYSAMLGDKISKLTFGIADSSKVAKKISDTIDKIKDTLGNMLEGVKSIAGGIASFFKDKLPNVKTIFGNFFTKTNTSTTSIWGNNSALNFGHGYGKGQKQNVDNTPDFKPAIIDGMYQYYQKDPLWSVEKGLDIAKSGCGPVSAAMVISSYAKKPITPISTAKFANVNKFRAPDGGTYPGYFEAVGKAYGVNMYQGGNDPEQIKASLSQKRPVILMGKGRFGSNASMMMSSPFGNSMHYLVANGIDDKGMVTVFDPLKKTPMKYSLNSLVRDTSATIFSNRPTNYWSAYNDAIKNSAYANGRVNANTIASVASGDYSGIADPNSPSSVTSVGDTTGGQKKYGVFDILDYIGSAVNGMVDVRFGFKSFNDLRNDYNASVSEGMPESEGAPEDYDGSVPLPSKVGKPYGVVPGSLLIPAYKENLYVHDWFGRRLENLAKSFGKKLQLTSGYRSIAKQQQLWDERKRKNPGEPDSITAKWVARPGKSRHNAGLAMDVDGWAKSLTNTDLAKFGLHKPLDYEDWHIEPNETKGLSTRQLIEKWGVPQLAGVSGEYGRGGSAALLGNVKAFNKKFGTGELLSTVRGINNNIATEFKKAGDARKIDDLESRVNGMATASLDSGFAMMATVMGEMLNVLKDIRDNTAESAKPEPIPVKPAPQPSAPVARAAKNTNLSDIMSPGAQMIDSITRK